MSYLALKHMHVTFVVLSVIFFIVRFFWLQKKPAMLEAKIVKIAPHVIDTLLLISAIGLMKITSQYPFVMDWLTLKLGFVILYIVAGFHCLKKAQQTKQQYFSFFVAILSVLIAVKLVYLKPMF